MGKENKSDIRKALREERHKRLKQSQEIGKLKERIGLLEKIILGRVTLGEYYAKLKAIEGKYSDL